MKCWHCNDELIWGGDHDADDDSHYSIVTNLSCPTCESYVEVFLPRETVKDSIKLFKATQLGLFDNKNLDVKVYAYEDDGEY